MIDPSANSVLSTTLTVAVSANTLFNLALGWVTWSLRSSAAKVTRLEDKLERTAASSDARQHELTNKLIDERMRGFSHDVANIMQDLKLAVADHEAFVQDSRREVQSLTEQDHIAELKVLTQIKDLQIEIVKNAATKQDLKEHEASMRREMNELRAQVRDDVRKA